MKTMKKLSKESLCPGRDSNPRPPEHFTRVIIIIRSRYSVISILYPSTERAFLFDGENFQSVVSNYVL